MWEAMLLLIACSFENESQLNKLNYNNENQLISYDIGSRVANLQE